MFARLASHPGMRIHIARITVTLLACVCAPRFGTIAMIAASIALFLAGFTWLHDLSHGALPLPRSWRERAVAIVGAMLLMSGHAMRAMHLRHHARIFAADDLEGQSA